MSITLFDTKHAETDDKHVPNSKLDKKLKKEWIAELRNGDYVQGQSQLRVFDEDDETYSYCCLGVLCDLVAPGNWENMEGELNLGEGFELNGERTWSFPPAAVYDIAGLSVEDANYLATLNDSGKSYDEIADWIEGNL